MTLPAVEFLRRFMLHVLPSGFVRIRHYGFLANRHRAAKLQRCRGLLGQAGPAEAAEPATPAPSEPSENGDREDHGRCPVCRIGRMRVLQRYPRPSVPQLLEAPWPLDSS